MISEPDPLLQLHHKMRSIFHATWYFREFMLHPRNTIQHDVAEHDKVRHPLRHKEGHSV